MGELIQPHSVEIFGEEDDYDVNKVNENTKKFNKIPKPIPYPALPANKALKHFISQFRVTNGSSGTKNKANATDANGVGSLWFGQYGIPVFEKIYSISIDHAPSPSRNSVDNQGLASIIAVIDVQDDHIKFAARRLESNSWAALYGSMELYLEIKGY